jgi:membrane protease YdiL (CAAX protease family)
MPRQLTESELIKKKAPNVWRVFWTYCVVLCVVIIFSLCMGDDGAAKKYTMFFASACMVLTTVVFEFIYWPSLAVQLKRLGLFTKYALLALPILAVLLLLNFAWHSFVINLDPDIRSFSETLNEMNLGPVATILVFCLIPGITEEIAYRGLIQHWLQTALSPWRAIVLASALFTAMHLSVVSAPYIFLLSLLLGWLKYKTRSLYPSMLIHILHNYAAITIFPLLDS